MTEEEVKTILRNIPNSVSGDGKTFVAALKNYLTKNGVAIDDKIKDATDDLTQKPNHVTNITLLELHTITDGVRSNNIQVSWDITPVEDYAKAEVWFKTNEGDSAWQKAGEASGTQYVLQGAETGKTYYIRVVAVNSKGNAANFDTAPQANIKIKGSQYIPVAPTQFVLTWDEQGPLWKWLFVDNNYVDFFELRLDQNPGVWNENRLDSTRETWSRVAPNTRSGTAYLYIRNIFGEYSEPAVHQFSKGQPGKPSAPILTSTLDGVRIKMESLPQGNTKYRLFIKTVDGNETNEGYFETANSEYIYFFFAGTITVMYQIVDPLGVGEWSDEVTANVKDLIVDADNIADGAITNDKIAANAVTAAKIAANSITGDKIAANTIDADNIAAGAINAKHLAAGSVGADAIQAGSIIGDKIAAGTITGSKLAAANIDLLGALTITGGNVKLSEEGLRLTGGDGSFTLFDSEGINYVDKNGVQYAQIKKMIIGKAYDGQYIKFAAPWAKAPSVLMCPMSIQINDINYSTASLFLVCEATDISESGFRVNNYLRLASGSYNVNNVFTTASVSSVNVESMTQYGYGHYTYYYNLNAYSNIMTVNIPNTVSYLEFSLQLTINALGTFAVDYPGANSGWTAMDNDTRTITVQLIVNNKVVKETSFTVDESSVIKNFILSASFSAGSTKAVIRIKWAYKLSTNDHGPWSTLYNGRSYIAKEVCKCKLDRTYYKYSASEAKIASGCAMFLVTDGSTNIYTAS